MTTYDLGDVARFVFLTKDTSGNAVNATTASCVVTLPDATTAAATITTSSTGSYVGAYTPTQAGRHQVRWVATGDYPQAATDVFEVRDASLLPLVSLQELKTHLRMSASTTDDEQLRNVLDAATAAAEGYTNRILAARTITETLDGEGLPSIALTHPVALSVSQVTENGSTVSASGYRLVSGVVLQRLSGYTASRWQDGVNNVSVTYTAGVTGREAYAASRGVLEIARHMWETQRGSMNIGGMADDWTPGQSFSIPNRAMQLLEPLRVIANA